MEEYVRTQWKNDSSPYLEAKNLKHIEDALVLHDGATRDNARDIATAQTNATTAKTNAAKALTNSNTAVSTANTAKQTAEKAEQTANTASTTAANARTTANSAKSYATEAKTIATEAKGLMVNLTAVNGIPSAQYAFGVLIITSGPTS